MFFLTVAALAFLVWDMLITFDDEVRAVVLFYRNPFVLTSGLGQIYMAVSVRSSLDLRCPKTYF